MHHSIYLPSEDSYLLSESVKKFIEDNKIISVLDMGSGSGIQSQTLIDNKINPKRLTLTDINLSAIKHLKVKFPKSKVIKSDLFNKIPKSSKFDLIIFNPPYLPEDENYKELKSSRVATTGGKRGSEIINKFLKQSKPHLNDDGHILLLTSSLTKGINWMDYKKKKIASKKLFFEELYVWDVIL